MKSSSPPSADWRETFKALRGEFEAGAEAHPTLRHAIVQALDGERTIPPDLSRKMKKAGEWRDEEWGEPWDFLDSYKDADGAYVRSLQDIWAATRSFLWGGRAGIKTFESLAERAWHALPGTLKAKAQAFPQPRIPQRWLGFVYRQLERGMGSSSLSADQFWSFDPKQKPDSQVLVVPISVKYKDIISERYLGALGLTAKARRWIVSP